MATIIDGKENELYLKPLLARRHIPNHREEDQRRLSIRKLLSNSIDIIERARGTSSRINTIRSRDLARTPVKSIAVYAHYNPSGRVSPMVISQLRHLVEQGFRTDFVTMSPISDPDDVQKLERVVDGIYERKSFGRDFGAWKDLWQVNKSVYREADELLLMNDSLLGPIQSLAPVFNSMRLADGMIGLTDSPDSIPHVQSYFVLFRGKKYLRDLGDFLEALPLSFNKDFMIYYGELGMTKFFLERGITPKVLYSYDDLERSSLEDPQTVIEIAQACSIAPREQASLGTGIGALRNSLLVFLDSRALNPTIYFWRTLLKRYQFPFIKAELVLRNPAGMPNVDDWRGIVSSRSEGDLILIESHLRMMCSGS